jgi:aspartyl/asparaginyl-tRNA synthetase
LGPFQEYLNLFKEEEPLLRGGFGIGFERFIGFLLNSNDILETITYRSMQPKNS